MRRAPIGSLASAITVFDRTTLGLPVSSTHIAIGAIFGIGFCGIAGKSEPDALSRGHRINQTADDAFDNIQSRLKRKPVRRRFVLSIAAAG
ncbi:MAG: hypothetical protein CM15mP115_06240 [Alphaproteobacteria bacterium]|nr:MAG: hypothetical protein CM15mP115_06240 [Alphaproteobacteria bacterium]